MSPDKKQQLDGIVQQMVQNKESDANIQMVVDDFKTKYSQKVTPSEGPTEESSMLGDMGRAIVNPLTRMAGSVAPAVDQFRGFSQDEIKQRNVEGRDFGFLGENVKPYGWQASSETMGVGEQTARMGLDVAGSAAEMGSYALAPLKAGMGLWGATKAAVKGGALIGAGEGGQKAGEENATAGEAIVEGAKVAAGATAAFGLLNVGSQFFRNYGAKALASEAVQKSAKAVKELSDSAYTVLGDVFNGTVDLADDFTNKSLSRAYNALSKQFNTQWKKASDSIIDSVIPNVTQPEIPLNRFHRALSKIMGTAFRGSDDAYGRVKLDETPISNFKIATESLKGQGDAVQINDFAPGSPEYKEFANKMLAGETGQSDLLTSFAGQMKPELSSPKTLGSIMEMWETAMQYLPRANNAEKKVIRDFANGLYDDAGNFLKKNNPELLDDWNIAWEQWGNASKIWDSSILQKLRSPGSTDNIVDTIVSGKINPAEQKVIDTVLENPETKQGFVDVVIGSVLRKVKGETLENGSKTIETFLQRWGKHLSPEQTQILDNLGAFTTGTFDEFIGGIGKMKGMDEDAIRELQSLSGAKAQELFDKSGKLEIGDFIKKGNFKGIADGMYSLFKKDPKNIEAVVGQMTAEEKQVVGLSMTRRIYDEGMEIFTKNQDGTFNISKAMVEAVNKTWDDVAGAMQKSGDDTLFGLFTPDQLTAMREASQMARNFNNVSGVPTNGVKRLLNSVMTVVYAKYGQLGSAARSGLKAVEKTPVSIKDFNKSIDELISSGIIDKNKAIKISDLLNILKIGVPVVNNANQDEE